MSQRKRHCGAAVTSSRRASKKEIRTPWDSSRSRVRDRIPGASGNAESEEEAMVDDIEPLQVNPTPPLQTLRIPASGENVCDVCGGTGLVKDEVCAVCGGAGHLPVPSGGV